MVDLLDVAMVPRKVNTKKYGELDVAGISVAGLANIIKAHPEVIDVFKGAENDAVSLDMQTVVDLGVDFLASFLAAGLSHPGDEKAIAMCKQMNSVDAWELGEAILEESFPGGAKNFFVKVGEAAQKADIVQMAKVAKAPS